VNCAKHLQIQPHGAPNPLKDPGAKFNLNAGEIANNAGNPLATTSFGEEEAIVAESACQRSVNFST